MRFPHNPDMDFGAGMRVRSLLLPRLAKVMAKNLMALEGKHTTVAVVGSAHLDGMEDTLSANGWRVKTTLGRRAETTARNQTAERAWRHS